jgi:predicted aldo/keto reductase-like oxidoreductase
MNIPIPDYFTLYNADKKKDYRPSRDKYGEISEGKGLASECIACGQCEGVCPQKLPIIENLKKVSMHFERK